MKLKTLTTAILLSLPTAGAFAAALDRSGQSISAFLQPDNYFEAGISVLDANVDGNVSKTFASSPALRGSSLSDMADSYYFPTAALKLQATENISVGLLYDQPFGAEATYSSADASGASYAPGPTSLGNLGAFHDGNGNSTNVEVHTQNISLIGGFQPNENLNIYAGGVYQEVKGHVELQGSTYGGAAAFGGYKAKIDKNEAYGWLAGIAYQIPEIALKASITYRSEIEHDVKIKESSSSPVNIGPSINALSGQAETNITTPQSVNLDFQTGVMANTIAFANLRWVNWKEFAIRPYAFGKVAPALAASTGKANGFDLVAYEDDQISATVGVGRKFNDLWAGNVSLGWDSGAGDPVTTLGPTEGYWNVGLGVQYSPTPATFIAGGVKYFWLGDAKAQSGSQFDTANYVAEFKDNHAIAYGLKMGYKF